MKRLILFEIIILFLATTFESDSPPPGWYQQTLPRTDVVIDDIFFIDSLLGWSTAHINPGFDSAFIFATTNGGNNWVVQHQVPIAVFNTIQFLDANTGYSAGGTGTARLYKTTNGGNIWINTATGMSGLGTLEDMFFVNKDTGWVCDANTFGGLSKTTNGGATWQLQLNDTAKPFKLFFINKDTGWVGTSDANGRLFRTIDGGGNWSLQYTINALFKTIYFINGKNGWIRAGATNGVEYTTDGGFTWSDAQGTLAGYDIKFVNDSVGFSGSVPNIARSTDGGKTWGYQVAPPNTYLSVYALASDTIHGWAGTYNIIRTTDGGGTINYLGLQFIGTEIPTDYNLHQNYPNPFNPTTNIVYELKVKKFVKLKVFDVTGKEITALVNREQQAGTYKVDWNASGYSSGVYFYSLIVDEITVDTKKMLLIK